MTNQPGSYGTPPPAQHPQQPQAPYGAPQPMWPPQQPPQYAQPAPPKKKGGALKVLLIAFGVVALLCIGGTVIAAALASNSDTSTNAGSNDSGGKNKLAAAGTPVRDGKFEFTVTSTKCGATKVGDDFLNQQAQGQFCLVTIKVHNIGKEARTLDASIQTAYDAKGAKYDADGVASLYANKNNESFLTNINPGNQVTAVFVFDVPKGTKLTKLELHDGLLSGGVQVAVA